MRDIKFRAWDNVFKEYDNSYFVIDEDGSLFELDGDKQNELDAKRFVVEQFTGLTDKNGKDIYEGDVINTTLGNIRQVVAYVSKTSDGSEIPGFFAIKDGNFGHLYSLHNDDNVLGNVHENASLLEAVQ